MGKFIVRNGELEGRKFRLEPGAKIVLGRERGDLNFPDKRMSRRHCVLESREDGDYLTDMGSTNGCWVNNERISEARLTPGDLLRVGFTELEFLGMPAPAFPPSALAGIVPTSGPVVNPNQTIAFRRIPDLTKPPAEAPAAPSVADVAGKSGGDAVSPGGTAVVNAGDALPQARTRDKGRMRAAKYAAMGKQLHGEKRLVSAKGKFCEACGEAIFMREGAPDEGVVTDGLYLCRMCALIAEKQKGLGADYLPSYAKIVSGRMPEKMPDELAQAIGVSEASAASSNDVQIVESEEVSLEELTGATPGSESSGDRASDTTATPPVSEPTTGAADVSAGSAVSPGTAAAHPLKDTSERGAATDAGAGDDKQVDPTKSIPLLPDEALIAKPPVKSVAKPSLTDVADAAPTSDVADLPRDISELADASESEIEAAVAAAVEAAMAASAAADEGESCTSDEHVSEDAPELDEDEPPEPIDAEDILSDMPLDNEDMATPPRGNPPVGDKPAEPKTDRSVSDRSRGSGGSDGPSARQHED